MKPRILLLSPVFKPNLGGVETHLGDLTYYLNSQNYPTTVLTYQPIITPAKGQPFEQIENLKIYRFKWISGNYFNTFVNMHPIFNFLYLTPYLFIRTFIYLLQHHQEVDVIHCIGLSTAISGKVFKAIFNKPVLYTSENLYLFKPNSLFKSVAGWVLRSMDVALVQSEDSRQEMLGLGLSPERIRLFRHWVNQDLFKPQDKLRLKKQLGWENKLTVLFVGRLIPEKGVNVFIEAARTIKKDMQFKMVGDDGQMLPEAKKAEQEIDNFQYVAGVRHDTLPPYYAAADIFVYPALYPEDVSLTLLEAMSSGTPVINTNPGSGIYKLSPDVAFVIEPTTAALKNKLEYLAKNPRTLASMTKSAPIFAKKFGPAIAKIITDAYSWAITHHTST